MLFEELVIAVVVRTYELDMVGEEKVVVAAETSVDHAQCLPDRSLSLESRRKRANCEDWGWRPSCFLACLLHAFAAATAYAVDPKRHIDDYSLLALAALGPWVRANMLGKASKEYLRPYMEESRQTNCVYSLGLQGWSWSSVDH